MYGLPLVASVILSVFLLGYLWSWVSSLSMAWMIGVPATILGLVLTAVLNGWVISCLWEWFIVPMGAPHMPVTSALGLSIILQTLLNQESKSDSESYKSYETVPQFLISLFIQIFLSRLVILFMGWLITFFQ